MNNQEILRQIVDYIKSVMDERSLSSRDLAKICAEKAGKMSPRTIDYMFKAPSSTTFGKLRMFFKRIRNKNTSVSEKSPESTQASDSNIPPESPSSIDVSPAAEQSGPENETPSSERDEKD